ncbi:hypothetical protein F5B20DRAFT_374124 [Whalleya microplaca]|nr:hypothetical protein F5B20DRAFT_374124 [Whalleya microplaca]
MVQRPAPPTSSSSSSLGHSQSLPTAETMSLNQKHATNSGGSTKSAPPNLPTPNHQIPLPHHFLVRPGATRHTASGTVTIPGPIVPLVAVDQLPEWLDLVGVPRELSLEQTVGLSNLGTVIRDPEYYEVAQTYSGYKDDDDGEVQQGPDTSVGNNCRHQQRQRRDDTADNSSSTNRAVNPPSTSSSSATVAPTNSRMDPAAKSFTSTSASTSKPGLGSSKHAPGTTNNRSNANANNTLSNTNATEPPTLIGLHPRLPSPTVTGSTPPGNPYPVIRAPAAPAHYASYANASPLHPADRLLAHSYTPQAPHAHAHKPNNTTSSNPNHGGGAGRASTHQQGTSRVYCHHWCHHGTCKWGRTCRYAHAMPGTVEGLREVGLREFPAWYMAAMAFAGPHHHPLGLGGLPLHPHQMAIGGGGGVWYPTVPQGGAAGGMLVAAGGGGGGGGGRRARERERRELMNAMAGTAGGSGGGGGKQQRREGGGEGEGIKDAERSQRQHQQRNRKGKGVDKTSAGSGGNNGPESRTKAEAVRKQPDQLEKEKAEAAAAADEEKRKLKELADAQKDQKLVDI